MAQYGTVLVVLTILHYARGCCSLENSALLIITVAHARSAIRTLSAHCTHCMHTACVLFLVLNNLRIITVVLRPLWIERLGIRHPSSGGIRHASLRHALHHALVYCMLRVVFCSRPVGWLMLQAHSCSASSELPLVNSCTVCRPR